MSPTPSFFLGPLTCIMRIRCPEPNPHFMLLLNKKPKLPAHPLTSTLGGSTGIQVLWSSGYHGVGDVQEVICTRTCQASETQPGNDSETACWALANQNSLLDSKHRGCLCSILWKKQCTASGSGAGDNGNERGGKIHGCGHFRLQRQNDPSNSLGTQTKPHAQAKCSVLKSDVEGSSAHQKIF